MRVSRKGAPGRHCDLEAALVLVVPIWVGMLLGVSFLATLAKFVAPSLTLPVALDVDRRTFGDFNPIEVKMTVIVTASSW